MQTDTGRTLAIVTGAGSGLGRALCQRFTERQVRVLGVSRREESGLETQQLCGPDAEFIPVTSDVSDTAAAEQVFSRLDRLEYDHLILVNNAGIYERHDFATDPLQVFDRAMQVNFGGAVRYSHLALQRMVPRGQGRIVNIGSFADIAPLPGSSGYSVSKGALRLFTRALVADLGKRFPGIVINDWIPGALDTKMGRADGLDPMVSAVWGVELALRHSADLNGRVFDMNKELTPVRSLKRRIAERLGVRPKYVPISLD